MQHLRIVFDSNIETARAARDVAEQCEGRTLCRVLLEKLTAYQIGEWKVSPLQSSGRLRELRNDVRARGASHVWRRFNRAMAELELLAASARAGGITGRRHLPSVQRRIGAKPINREVEKRPRLW